MVNFLGVLPGDRVAAGKLEDDGFPAIGTYLQEGDPFYRYVFLRACLRMCTFVPSNHDVLLLTVLLTLSVYIYHVCMMIMQTL